MTHQVPAITVLLIEDDEDAYVILRDYLAQVPHSKFKLHWEDDFELGLHALFEGKYDVCLLDYRLGDRDGLEFIREATLRGSRVPIIFLTGWDDLETDIQAMKEGASDYLVKGEITPPFLERSIRYVIERKEKELEVVKYRKELERLVQERTAELSRAKEEAFKKAEEAEEGKRILDALLEHIPEGIALTGGPPDYPIKLVSRTGQNLTGRARNEIVGMPAGDHVKAWGLYLPDGVTQPKREETSLYRAAKLGTVVKDEEWILKRPDGRNIHILCNAAAIRDKKGEIIGGIKAWRDITDRKLAEEKTKESLAQLHVVMQTMEEGLLLVDGEGHILMANQAMLRLVGLPETPMENIRDYASRIEATDSEGNSVPPEMLPISRALRGEIVRDVEHRIRRRDTGRSYVALYSAAPVMDADGRVTMAVVTVRDITTRKRVEELLRESEEAARQRAEELKKIMDLVPVAIWVSRDRECRRIIGNQAANQFYESGEGKNVSAGPAPGKQDFARRFFRNGRELKPEELPMQKAASKGIDVRNAEIDVLRPSGSMITVMGNASPLMGSNGEIRGCVAAFMDITERKRMEEDLRKSFKEAEEGRLILSAMMDHIPMGITIADAPDVKIRAVSRYGRMLTQRTPEQIEGITVDRHTEQWEIYLPDGVTPARNEDLPLTRATQKGEIIKEEEWVIGRPDGTKIPILCSAGPIRDSQGKITGGVVGWQDMTEIKEAEGVLRRAHDDLELRVRTRTRELEKAKSDLEESERRFREVLEASLDVAYRRNIREETYDYIGPGIRALSGYAVEEIISMSREELLTLIHPDDLVRIQREFLQAERESKERYFLEFRFRKKEGVYRWFSNLMSIVKDSEGRPLYRVGNIRDITEQKEAEEALRAYAAKLENLNRDLEDFTFIAAHDLQEPLRKIQVFSDRILGEYGSSLDETGRDYIMRMTASANRLQKLIRDIRAYSKVTGNPSPYEKVDVEKVFREVVSNLEFQIRNTGATIQIGDLPSLEADPHLMYLLFQNLLSNALKYRNTDHLEIKVSSRKEDGNLRILVEDNGIGFDEKYLDQIFRPFKRLHGREEYEGTGMGLAICKKIVERHGGTITAKSTPGEGSTFIINLPVSQKDRGSRD